jgi:hypothetical protein
LIGGAPLDNGIWEARGKIEGAISPYEVRRARITFTYKE